MSLFQRTTKSGRLQSGSPRAAVTQQKPKRRKLELRRKQVFEEGYSFGDLVFDPYVKPPKHIDHRGKRYYYNSTHTFRHTALREVTRLRAKGYTAKVFNRILVADSGILHDKYARAARRQAGFLVYKCWAHSLASGS